MGSAVAGEPASIPSWAATGIRPVFSSFFALRCCPWEAHAAEVPDWGRQRGPAPAHDFRGRCETLWTGTLSNMPRGIKYTKSTAKFMGFLFLFLAACLILCCLSVGENEGGELADLHVNFAKSQVFRQPCCPVLPAQPLATDQSCLQVFDESDRLDWLFSVEPKKQPSRRCHALCPCP